MGEKERTDKPFRPKNLAPNQTKSMAILARKREREKKNMDNLIWAKVGIIEELSELCKIN